MVDFALVSRVTISVQRPERLEPHMLVRRQHSRNPFFNIEIKSTESPWSLSKKKIDDHMKSSFCYFGQSSRGRMVSMGGLTYSYSNSGRKEVLRREIQKTPSRNIYARR